MNSNDNPSTDETEAQRKLDEYTQSVIDKGKVAWSELKTYETWDKWVIIGRALEAELRERRKRRRDKH